MTDDEQKFLSVGADAALKPFANLIERLFGGSIDQIGGAWEDRLKVRRHIRQLRLMEKLNAHIEEIGFQPQPIPDKIWLPALQAALCEDDDVLQEHWAALLANASIPDSKAVQPFFVEILRQLSPPDARLLWGIHEQPVKNNVPRTLAPDALRRAVLEYRFGEPILLRSWDLLGYSQSGSHSLTIAQSAAFGAVRTKDLQNLYVSVGNLLRLGLFTKAAKITIPMPTFEDIKRGSEYAGQTMEHKEDDLYTLTELGYEFVMACSKPSAQQETS